MFIKIFLQKVCVALLCVIVASRDRRLISEMSLTEPLSAGKRPLYAGNKHERTQTEDT